MVDTVENVETLGNVDIITCKDRDDWLQKRQTLGIGSSDVPVLLGLSRFKSPFVLYHEKLGVQPPSRGEQLQRRLGLLLEEPIAQLYQEETKRNVSKFPEFTVARSRTHPFMVASIDRFTGQGSLVKSPPAEGIGVLELKTAHPIMREEWMETGEPPIEYQVQLQHQLAVLGLQWGAIAVLIGGYAFYWQDVPRDDALIAKLVEIESDFMVRLGTSNPPPVDGHETTAALLKVLHPKDNGTAVPLPPEAIEIHDRLLVVKEQLKTLNVDKDECENMLKAWIGDATLGVLPNNTSYSYKLQQRAGYTVAPTEFRVLRLVGKGKKT